jgi:hypothetical protein
MERVRAPDGREWELHAFRFRLPPWRQNSYSPEFDLSIVSVFEYLVLLPIAVVVVPIAVFVAELPISLVRGVFGRGRWIEAVCWYPQTMRIVWRVDDRRKLRASFERLRGQLAQGYTGLEFEGARIVERTPPAMPGDQWW